VNRALVLGLASISEPFETGAFINEAFTYDGSLVMILPVVISHMVWNFRHSLLVSFSRTALVSGNIEMDVSLWIISYVSRPVILVISFLGLSNKSVMDNLAQHRVPVRQPLVDILLTHPLTTAREYRKRPRNLTVHLTSCSITESSTTLHLP
jgi:hypothetical protein